MSKIMMTHIKAWCFLASVLLSHGLQAGVIIINGLSHHHKVAAGMTYRGSIELQNTADKAQSVRVYQKDYRFYHTGEATYDMPGTSPRSNANWIDFSPKHLELKGMEKSVIRYEITIPDGADSLEGTFWSVIMVEGINPIDTAAAQKGLNVQTVVRYAIQISSSFGESGKANLKFLNVELQKEGPQRFLKVEVENDGDRYLLTEMVLEFFNSEGISAGVFKSEQRTTYPGTSVSFLIPVNGALPGLYKALLVANSSEQDVFGLNLTIDIHDD